MTEIATETVRLSVSPELLEEMIGRWSSPVRVRVERDRREPTGWAMVIQTLPDYDADVVCRKLLGMRDDIQDLADEVGKL